MRGLRRRAQPSHAEVAATVIKAVRDARDDHAGQVSRALDEIAALRRELKGFGDTVTDLADATRAVLAAGRAGPTAGAAPKPPAASGKEGKP